tara:strand:- start:72 stop:596 length:525 start_codon:yes stop_codon:yes gene_type:complete
MKIKFIKYVFIFFGIFILFIFYFGLNHEKNYDTKKLIGNKIPKFNIQSFDDREYLTEENFNIKNNFTLINFWASWCPPCRKEHPILLKLQEAKNLNLIGINYKDDKKKAKIFLDKLGNPFDLLGYDKNGKNLIAFGIYGIPESILLNEQNIIIKKFIGPLSLEDYNIILGEMKE